MSDHDRHKARFQRARDIAEGPPTPRYRGEPMCFVVGGYALDAAGTALATIPGSVVVRAGGRYLFDAGRWEWIGAIVDAAQPAPEAAA